MLPSEFAKNCQAALEEDLLGRTLAPFFRASESPMAIACLRLLTRPPFPRFPERSVPLLRRRIALSTDLLAAFPYRRPRELLELVFLAGIFPPAP